MKHKLLIILFALIPFLGYGQGQQWQGNPTQLNGWYGGITANKFMRLPHNVPSFTWFDSCGRIWFDSTTTQAVYFNDCAQRIKLLSIKDTDFIKSLISGSSADTTGLASRLWVNSNFFKQNGNSFNDTGRIGTNDSYAFVIETKNRKQLIIDTLGAVSIGIPVTGNTEGNGQEAVNVYSNAVSNLNFYKFNNNQPFGSGLGSINNIRWWAHTKSGDQLVASITGKYVATDSNTNPGGIDFAVGNGSGTRPVVLSISPNLTTAQSHLVVSPYQTSTPLYPIGTKPSALFTVTNNYFGDENPADTLARIKGGVNQSSDLLQFVDYQNHVNSRVDHHGKFHIKSLNIISDTAITSSYTVPYDKDFVEANTASGNITITLSTASYSVGKTVYIHKHSSDTNVVTITPTTGDIDGQSSFSFNSHRGVMLRLKSDGNYTLYEFQSENDNASSTNLKTWSFFGVKADLVRTWMSFTSGSHTVTAASGTFSTSDIGKYIVGDGRQYLAYSTDTLRKTAKITGYTNSSTVTTDSVWDLTTIDSFAYFATDNGNAIQSGINYCNANNIGTFYNDLEGIVCVFPKFSDSLVSFAPEVRGFQVRAPLAIIGSSKDVSKVKFSVEDDIHINTANNYQWNGFIDYTNGGFKISDMTLLAPDRACLSYTPADSSGAAITLPSGFKYGYTFIDHIDIVGDSLGRKPNWDLSWPNAVQSSSSDTLHYYSLIIKDSKLQCAYQNITCFAPRGGYKTFIMENCVTENSGSPLMGTLFTNAATIASGSDTVTLHSTQSITHPSWYNFTSGIGLSRQYMLYFYNGIDTFSARMVNVVNDTVCVLSRNATASFTLANMQSKGVQNINYGEGQNSYDHPVFTKIWRHIRIVDAYGLGDQCYSSHGDAPVPSSIYRVYDDVVSATGRRNITDLGLLLGNGNQCDNTLRDCDFHIYSLGYPMKIQAWNCNFRDLSAFYDTSELHNCKGSIYVVGTPMQMNIYGGNFSNIYIHQLDSGTTNIYGDSVTLIANNSVHNGVVNTFGSTVIGSKTGVGALHQYPKETDTTTNISSIKRVNDTAAAIRTTIVALPTVASGYGWSNTAGIGNIDSTIAVINGGTAVTDTLKIGATSQKELMLFGLNRKSILHIGESGTRFEFNFNNAAGNSNRIIYNPLGNGLNMTTKTPIVLERFAGPTASNGRNTALVDIQPYYMPATTSDSTNLRSGYTITTYNQAGAFGEDFKLLPAFFQFQRRTVISPTSYLGSFTGAAANTLPPDLFLVYNLGGTTTDNVLTVRGMASQSGRLQRWLKSDSTELAYVDASGNIGTNADLLLKTAGNKLHIKTGTNASMGTATLSGGTVTVNTTAVTANSLIFITRNTPSGTTGDLSAPVASITAGTSFVINSTSATEASTVNWIIIDNQ